MWSVNFSSLFWVTLALGRETPTPPDILARNILPCLYDYLHGVNKTISAIQRQ